MTRTRYRSREYPIPDREPEPAMLAMQCCVCEERSEYTETPETGANWALGHLKATTHFTYRLLRTTLVRTEPGARL